MAIRTPEMGLTIWNNGLDPYNSKQLGANFTAIEFHDHTPGRGHRIGTAALADNSVTSPKLTDSVYAVVDRSTPGGTTRRGKAIIPTVETYASGSFGLLPTPDRVTVTLPTDGLIFVAYQAHWTSSNNADTATASLFLGSNRVVRAEPSQSTPQYNYADQSWTTGGVYQPLCSFAGGLRSGGNIISYTDDVTTGQLVGAGGAQYATNASGVGGPATIFGQAGTYDVSVQYSCNSGTGGHLTIANRKLWVWTESF